MPNVSGPPGDIFLSIFVLTTSDHGEKRWWKLRVPAIIISLRQVRCESHHTPFTPPPNAWLGDTM